MLCLIYKQSCLYELCHKYLQYLFHLDTKPQLHSDVATVISVNFKLLLCLVQEFSVIQLFASRQRWTSGGEIDRLSCSFLHLVGKVRALPPYTVTLK